MTDTPRIYVASLSDYNAGRLHGEWIDATQELDDIWAEIHAMLAKSPEARICQMCGGKLTDGHGDKSDAKTWVHHVDTGGRSGKCTTPFPGNAEEWAVHDYDNFGSLPSTLGEWPSIEKVQAIATAIEESDNADALLAWLEFDSDHIDRIEDFAGEFQGEYESERAYVEEFLNERGWGSWVYGNREGQECYACHNQPGSLSPEQLEIVWAYLDFDHIANEMKICDIAWFVPAKPYGVYVFSG